MKTSRDAVVYRHDQRPLAPGACSSCGKVVKVFPDGRRPSHSDRRGRQCPGTGAIVVDFVEAGVPVRPVVATTHRTRRPDPRRCICGWRPRRKRDGTFAAHRIEPDNPCAPYCPNGAERSR